MSSLSTVAPTLAALPIRLEPRTADWWELEAQNRAEGRVGARTFLSAIGACSDIDVAGSGPASPAVRQT